MAGTILFSAASHFRRVKLLRAQSTAPHSLQWGEISGTSPEKIRLEIYHTWAALGTPGAHMKAKQMSACPAA